ncbi:MAG: GH32 C-terminal domain-containing protein, partial [Selenomonadaceae bacterium]|nr:GH32 C-terminal domain-containing protein [Selenomonadaceae bacterium]
KELECMRDEGVHYKDLALDKETQLDGVKGTCGELLFDVDVNASGNNFEFDLFSSDKEKTAVKYYLEEGQPVIELNRDQTIEGGKGVRKVILHPFGDILKFRIFLDKSAIEIFINDGAEVMSTRVYPQEESQNIVFIPQSEKFVIKSLDFYNF